MAADGGGQSREGFPDEAGGEGMGIGKQQEMCGGMIEDTHNHSIDKGGRVEGREGGRLMDDRW